MFKWIHVDPEEYALLSICAGNHRGQAAYPHKGPVTREALLYEMMSSYMNPQWADDIKKQKHHFMVY